MTISELVLPQKKDLAIAKDEAEALITINKANEYLILAERLEDVIKVKDFASIAQAVARVKHYEEAEGSAIKLKLQAERKGGQKLQETPKNPGSKNLGGNNLRPPKLEELGITKSESSRWQKIALVPEERFNKLLEDSTKASQNAILEVAKEFEKEYNRENPIPVSVPTSIKVQITQGDFRNSTSILSDSIDLIFTDPPYGVEYLEIWGALGKLGARVLKPGGWLVCYTGHAWLPEKIQGLISGGLKYDWICALMGEQTGSLQKGDYESHWKPVLILSKPPRGEKLTYSDRISADPDFKKDKRFHDWGQDLAPTCSFINVFSKVGDTVLEPFAGGGTTIEACIETKRHVIAYENNPESYRILKKRFPDSKPYLTMEPKKA